ncbi:MAG TPA: c-type cytochrome domain-containing protein, partial [Verrucomicrobiaceae bacterium]
MVLAATGLLCWNATQGAVPEKPDFNKHVRPILAGTCFKCHGVDEKLRKGKLRLDLREAAVEKKAIVPGDAAASELVKRIFTNDADEAMPPPKERMDLTADQKEILRRWIDAGAEYQMHWAFIPPVKPPVPRENTKYLSQFTSEIDAFVLQRLEEENLSPAPEADREHWLRRVTLDLTGLPPTL